MFRGALALVLRYLLLVGGGALVSAGVITGSVGDTFCFSAKAVADFAATGIALMLGGGASVATGIGWRFWAKRRGGVT